MDRARLSESTIERIRRERYAPSFRQYDYLHLRDLRRALAAALAAPVRISGPALDLYCGTQPYRDLIPVNPVWGLDLDRHFGRADVVGATTLPFSDAAFALVLCTQALHLVDDPATTVHEMARVLMPGGSVIVTVPHVFRKEIPQERQLSRDELRELFGEWDARIDGFGGRMSAAMYAVAGLHGALARRWFPIRILGIPIAVIVNSVLVVAELLLNSFNGQF